MKIEHAKKLIDFINQGSCDFLVVENIKNRLKSEGFIEVKQEESWNLEPFGKYFFIKNSSSVISFIVGEDILENGFKIIASHLDSPAFCLKPDCELKISDRYLMLNTEGYGGMILYSWLDRPLGISGRVVLRGENHFSPIEKNVDFKKPLLTIPSIAIHLNREVNNGIKLSKQKHMLPILSLTDKETSEKDLIYNLIAKELNIDKKDILDYELFLYEYEKGSLIGLGEEMISCTRLDDLMMAFNSLESFIKQSKNTEQKGIKVALFLDSEEIGSKTAQGADSNLAREVLRRIAQNIFKDDEAFHKILAKSFAISADLAHALHPAYPEKHDLTNHNFVGGGVCIKYSANKRYATDSFSSAVFFNLCDEANIKHQKFVNNSEIVGGSTIGPILASELGIPVIDIGCSILAMHSIRELASVSDNYECFKLFCEFYNN